MLPPSTPISPTAYLQQQLDTALCEPDPVRANYLITRCHYLLSQALQEALGEGAGANFHSWAVWGSRKAGVTIRQEDLDDARRDGARMGGVVGGLVGIGSGYWLGWAPGWLPAAALLGAGGGLLAGRWLVRQSRRRAARLVLAGNRTVLEDIGVQTVRFLTWLTQAAPTQPADSAAFLAALRPGPIGQANQELLRQAFVHYYRARCAQTVREKQQATYLGNCFAVWHEHVRLEPYIQGAMPLIIRRCVTQRLLQFEVGARQLAVAQDVPALALPPAWDAEAAPPVQDALALLRWGSDSATAGWGAFANTAARDWTRLAQRLRYIFALFRAFHTEPEVFARPTPVAALPGRVADPQTRVSQERMQLLSDTFLALYNGDNLEEVLVALKEQGATQLECTKLLYSALGLSLSQADAIVFQAEAWREQKETNTVLRNLFFE